MNSLKVIFFSSMTLLMLVLIACAIMLTSKALTSVEDFSKSLAHQAQQKSENDTARLFTEIALLKASFQEIDERLAIAMEVTNETRDISRHVVESLERIANQRSGLQQKVVDVQRNGEKNAQDRVVELNARILRSFAKAAAAKLEKDGEYWDDAEPVLADFQAKKQFGDFTYRYFSSVKKDKFTLVLIPVMPNHPRVPEDLRGAKIGYVLTSSNKVYVCKELPSTDAQDYTVTDWAGDSLPNEGTWKKTAAQKAERIRAKKEK